MGFQVRGFKPVSCTTAPTMDEFRTWLGGRDGTGYVLGFKIALGRKQTLVDAFNWKGEKLSRELGLCGGARKARSKKGGITAVAAFETSSTSFLL